MPLEIEAEWNLFCRMINVWFMGTARERRWEIVGLTFHIG
jgi:hypothetical protein